MPAPDVTTLLLQAREGDASALDRLLPVVYDDLLALARRQRGAWGRHETVNTTALVHEAYLRLARKESLGFADRVHFFRVAGRVMRAVLVDYGRAQRADKRGGRGRAVTIDDEALTVADVAGPTDIRLDEALAVAEAVGALETFDALLARVVECRYFAGLSVEETAAALDLSTATVKRRWSLARGWLYHRLREVPEAP